MKNALFTLILMLFVFNLIDPSLALSDYQRGVLAVSYTHLTLPTNREV